MNDYDYRYYKKLYFRQIDKHDSLREAKRHAIEVALGLDYPLSVCDTIVAATKEAGIDRALTNARKSA
jgi:hypothetical protein